MKQINFYSKGTKIVFTPEGEQKVANVNRRAAIVGIYDEETKELSIGETITSKRDNFIRKIGRKIAAGRATQKPSIVISNLETTKDAVNVFLDHAINFCKSNGLQVKEFKKNQNEQNVPQEEIPA